MRNNLKYITLIILLAAFSSCDNYLDIQPKGKVIPERIEHYDLLLNGTATGGPSAAPITSTSQADLIFGSADDFNITSSSIGEVDDPNNYLVKWITWAKDVYASPDESIDQWSTPYQNIYIFNLVVNGIDEAIGSDENARKRVKAEARTLRAYEYYVLINSFATQYVEGDADSDLGVPIITEADVAQTYDSRATVQQVYDFIIKDLTESVNDLPDNNNVYTRPNKGVAYALLARTYLQMGKYDLARTNAVNALNENGVIEDYTQDIMSVLDLSVKYRKEQYMFKLFGYPYGFSSGYISDDLLSVFDTANDSRLGPNGFWNLSMDWVQENGTWVQVPGEGYKFTSGRNWYRNQSMSVSEMYLIRAECNARLSDGALADVLDDLNELQSKRIRAYVNLTATDVADKNEALLLVLKERRREMSATGHRWYDLKRLNKESAFAKTITHTIAGTDYQLAPNSVNYVFPIPVHTLKFVGLEQNPRE